MLLASYAVHAKVGWLVMHMHLSPPVVTAASLACFMYCPAKMRVKMGPSLKCISLCSWKFRGIVVKMCQFSSRPSMAGLSFCSARMENSQWPHPSVDNQRKSAQEEHDQYFFFFFFFSVSLVKYTMKAAVPVTLTNLIISALPAVQTMAHVIRVYKNIFKVIGLNQ